MPRRVRLYAAELHYEAGIRLHTATSGAIDALNEVYLVVEEDGRVLAAGGVRTNITYLTGVPEPHLHHAIVTLVDALDWKRSLIDLHRDLSAFENRAHGAARALLDCALLDGLARQEGKPLAVYLGAAFRPDCATNQTLFWGSDDQLERIVRRHLDAGFRTLKLRVGVRTFADDLRRLRLVREIAGKTVTLAIDVNGTWSASEARGNLKALVPLQLDYVEQPIAAGDWDAMAALAAASPIPIMLDESLASSADIEALASRRAAPLAHLKLVKLGGITPLIAAARLLAASGIGIMVGQMNEGALATAAAAHAALVVQPVYAELYGAYGLVDDPASGLAYRQGAVVLAARPGLGVDLDPARLPVLWEKTL